MNYRPPYAATNRTTPIQLGVFVEPATWRQLDVIAKRQNKARSTVAAELLKHAVDLQSALENANGNAKASRTAKAPAGEDEASQRREVQGQPQTA